ncbi:MAG: hypothetical protein ABI444_00710 [Candidatus Kapaibacterium sp.]|jgi:anti-sigma factor RsiW
MMHLTEEQLFDFVEGTLPVSEQSPIAQHISECTACQARVTLSRSIKTALASQIPLEPSIHFTHDLMRSILAEPSTAPNAQASMAPRFVWNTQLAFVAAFFLIAGLCISPFFIPDHLIPGVIGRSSNAMQSLSDAFARFFANPLTPICLSAAIIVVAFSFFETLLPRSNRK